MIIVIGDPRTNMAKTQAGLTTTDAEQLAEIMQGLASSVRLRILSVLRERPSTVTELSAQLALGQTTISNHLRLLRHLDLVTGDRDGRHVHYALFDDHVTELLDAAVGHLGHSSPG
jgi:DNA-binding transcriptional ArsR family regulator